MGYGPLRVGTCCGVATERSPYGPQVARCESVAARQNGPMDEAQRRDAFVEHIDDAASGTFEITAIAIGLRLGLYRALADAGPLTAAELAAQTGTAERPVREWLEHGAVTGHLDVATD